MEVVDRLQILVNFGKIMGLFWVLRLHPDSWKICLIIQLYRKCTQAYPFKCSNSSSLCSHSMANSVFSLSLTSNCRRAASNSGNTERCDVIFSFFFRHWVTPRPTRLMLIYLHLLKSMRLLATLVIWVFFFVKMMFWLFFFFYHLIILFKIPKGNKYLHKWTVF